MEFNADDLVGIDLPGLKGRLYEVNSANIAIFRENAVLQSYLGRHVSPQEAEEWAAADDEGRRSGRRSRGPSKAKKPTVRPVAVTIDQKLDLVTAELDAARQETSNMKSLASKTLDKLRALSEQSDARIASVKREAYEFKKDVVIGGENTLTGRIRAERMQKYYEDSLQRKDNTIEQLRLKSESLRAALAKGRDTLRRKEEVGDTLHYIDFLQLQIENKQLVGRLGERSGEMVRLKASTAATGRSQNDFKARLADLQKECGRLRGEIRGRSGVLGRVRGETALIEEELAALRASAAGLAKTAQLAQEGGGGALELPTSIDYITLVALEKQLGREVRSWERKAEIASLAARNSAQRRCADDGLTLQ